VLLELFRANGLDIKKWYRFDGNGAGIKKPSDAVTFSTIQNRVERSFHEHKQRERKAKARTTQAEGRRQAHAKHAKHEERVAAVLAKGNGQ